MALTPAGGSEHRNPFGIETGQRRPYVALGTTALAIAERRVAISHPLMDKSAPRQDCGDSSTGYCSKTFKCYQEQMFGPQIIARTLSVPTRTDKHGNQWQYHSRSDHHSKVACWAIMFDLMQECALLRKHIKSGYICYGINLEMRDFERDRKKNLDLVICTPSSELSQKNFVDLRDQYEIELSSAEALALDTLPPLRQARVGSVIMALEAKACMTAHQRALPRLFDELNSSHQTVHGATEQALAVGFAMINFATDYLSPDQNKQNRATQPSWSNHNQPRDGSLAIGKVEQLPRRSSPSGVGYDAFAVMGIVLANDGSPVSVFSDPPAPNEGDNFHYVSMIKRLSHLYSTRFKDLI